MFLAGCALNFGTVPVLRSRFSDGHGRAASSRDRTARSHRRHVMVMASLFSVGCCLPADVLPTKERTRLEILVNEKGGRRGDALRLSPIDDL